MGEEKRTPGLGDSTQRRDTERFLNPELHFWRRSLKPLPYLIRLPWRLPAFAGGFFFYSSPFELLYEKVGNFMRKFGRKTENTLLFWNGAA